MWLLWDWHMEELMYLVAYHIAVAICKGVFVVAITDNLQRCPG
jgi:hypothetical protein